MSAVHCMMKKTGRVLDRASASMCCVPWPAWRHVLRSITTSITTSIAGEERESEVHTTSVLSLVTVRASMQNES